MKVASGHALKGGEGGSKLILWRGDRSLLVSTDRDVLKNCSVNRD